MASWPLEYPEIKLKDSQSGLSRILAYWFGHFIWLPNQRDFIFSVDSRISKF